MNVLRANRLWAGILIGMLLHVPNLSHAQPETEKEYEIFFAKGALRLENGEYAEAISSLEKAATIKPRDKAAAQALGIAYSRAGDFQNAKKQLRKALEIDSTDRRTRYELGVACYQLGEVGDAKRYFSAVVEEGAGDQLTSAAKKYLDLSAREKAGAFTLDVLAGFQHDSNVILEPSSPGGAEDKKSDWRAIATAHAAYSVVKTKSTSAGLGYSVYQSVHESLHAFNVQQHDIMVNTARQATQNSQARLDYRFSLASVGGDRYSEVHAVSPALSRQFTPAQSAELYFAHESRRFFDSAEFAQNSDRSGNNNKVGVAYQADFGKGVRASAGYSSARESTNAPWWTYRGWSWTAGLNAERAGFNLFLELSVHDERYGDLFPGFTEKRHDRAQEYSLGLVRKLTRRVSLDLSELYVINRSNLGPFDYTRNIVGLFAVIQL